MKTDEVNVKLRLTMLKPLHAEWKKIIESLRRVAGITDAICLRSKPTIDLFHDIERKIGTCVWKQMTKATNRIGSSIPNAFDAFEENMD